MLITESQLGFNKPRFDSLNLLDNMNYLTEAESVYSPALVPVVENTNIGAHLIRLEDMVSFAESNGIEDLGYALSLVCESSEIQPNTVAFTVQEENLIADNELADLTMGIMEAGVNVIAKPLNENHPMGILTDIAMNYFLETGDDYLLDTLTVDPVALAEGWFSEAVAKKRQTKADKELSDLMASGRENADEARKREEAAAERRKEVAKRRAEIEAKKKSDPEFADKALGYQVQNIQANNEYNKAEAEKKEAKQAAYKATLGNNGQALPNPQSAESFLDKVKKYGNKGRDAIASVIAKLHGWAQKINAEISNMDPEKRSIWQKIKQKVTAAIQFLTAKLHNAIASNARAELAAK